MALDLGPGVSRTLEALERQFDSVVWQKARPPLHSELNLMSAIETEKVSNLIRSVMPSGFFGDPTRAIADFRVDEKWVNQFALGTVENPGGPGEPPTVWANVNGWILPVSGTDIEEDATNLIKLYPPPESDDRVDFVFLEVWRGLVAPNQSTLNKPSASTLWKYGNVQYGGTNLVDDLKDGNIASETTKRVQIQYRLRVFGSGVGLGSGVALDVYPDGLGDPNVKGQGTATSPGTSSFTNMKDELSDPSLWRAGDGDPTNTLGTVDGYTYAIPVCAVFRRNSQTYTAVNEAGNPNQNGAFERTPSVKNLADPLTGAKELTVPLLTAALSPSQTGTVSITNLNGSGLDDPDLNLASTFLILDEEIIGISAVDVNAGTITISSRGRGSSAAVGHSAAQVVLIFNSRPDGSFADEITETDLLDLRRMVTPGQWDYTQLLKHNVEALAKGELHTSWKMSGTSSTEGVVVHEVDYMHADGGTANPNQTEAMDGPDGIRTVWSDGATIQPDVTILLDNDATVVDNGVGLTTGDQFDTLVRWDVGPDFKPVGFLNLGGGPSASWTNGSSIFMFIGGETGSEGARNTFRDGSERDVRFLMPEEMWKTGYPVVDPKAGNQHPVTARFLNERAFEPAPSVLNATEAARHVGPMYPWRDSDFVYPFITLGGLLDSTLKLTGIPSADFTNPGEIDLGVNFDTSGSFYLKDANGNFLNNPAQVSSPLLRDQRTLFGMLTQDGQDRTGSGSEVFLVIYGDKDSQNNNGAFRVIGAGTAGYTANAASNATSVVVEALSTEFSSFDVGTGNTVTIEFRSPHHNADDPSNYAARTADLAIVLTDIGGLTPGLPWNVGTLGDGESYDLAMPIDGGTGNVAVPSKLALGLSLLYHPGRSATARVPDAIDRVNLVSAGTGSTGGSGTYLSQSPMDIDGDFAVSGTPDEVFFKPVHVQTWNRLPAYGWHAPSAPNYGGNVVGFTEIDRESQAFVDKGSKTLVFRPLRDRQMTLNQHRFTDAALTTGLMGEYAYLATGNPKDGVQIFTGTTASDGKESGFVVPREYMPRFGRQDIPYYRLTGTPDAFLPGINHLFTDKADATNPVFSIIGGEDNVTSGNEVTMFHFVTGTPTCYGNSDTVIGGTLNIANIEARKTTQIDSAVQYADEVIAALKGVNSSDFGRGLKGIQLPPYYGLARVAGVYELEDFKSQGGRTFNSDRYTEAPDPATNLLREDMDVNSLFILQNGAKDWTGVEGDHTYIIPSTALDLSRAGDTTSVFDDFEYVVVCTVFGFGRGFINESNYVLARRHDGQGDTILDTSDLEREGVPMCIPCAAGLNDQLYVAYNRSPYQGDPFFTRAGETRTTSDYEHRYGGVNIANQFALKTAIQQFDALTGDFVPQTPNARTFEVLASMDFYTTLGTGKMGGKLFAGTPLDVGFTENSPRAALRQPDEQGSPDWRVLPRAFTEGQKENTSRASASLQFLDNDSLDLANQHGEAFQVKITTVDGTETNLYGVQSIAQLGWDGTIPDGEVKVAELAHMFDIDTVSKSLSSYFEYTYSFGTLDPTVGNRHATVTVPKGTWDPNNLYDTTQQRILASVSPKSDVSTTYGGTFFLAWIEVNGDLKVQAVWTASYLQFDSDANSIFTTSVSFDPVASGGSDVKSLAWADALVGDLVLITPLAPAASYPLTYHAYVPSGGQIDFVAFNASAGLISPAAQTFQVAIYRDVDPSGFSIPLVDIDLDVLVTQHIGDAGQTAISFAELINNHADFKSVVTAHYVGDTVTLEAVPVGAEGNDIKIEIKHVINSTVGDLVPTAPAAGTVETTLKLKVPRNNERGLKQSSPYTPNVTMVNLAGGIDLPVNAGNGTSQLKLTGMTERLPMGSLLQDSDFLCENPLGDTASAMKSFMSSLRPVQTSLPLTDGGDEFDRFFGGPGALLGMSDGHITIGSFSAWTDTMPSGTKRFRLYRGGGSAFVMGGKNPGGPIDWVSDTFPQSSLPVVKGGVLVCRALLVRNYEETAFNTNDTVSYGDEIQMVIITQGIIGDINTQTQGMNLSGIISPAGYGEGYSAADRYRIEGRPMIRGYGRGVPDPSEVDLAIYDEGARVPTDAELGC